MRYSCCYQSPIGEIFMAADEIGLTELHFSEPLFEKYEEIDLPIFEKTRTWLDMYFSGQTPDFMPPIHIISSDFQLAVWKILLKIPFGKTTTYGEIAKIIAKRRGFLRMSAQAVGGAVGRNKIAIIIPCHRVIGANGNLTGYAGGINRKIQLLQYEGIDTSKLITPPQKNRQTQNPF